MLGYTPEEFPGRAVLEAVGAGQAVDPGHVLAFAALRPAERRDDGLWLTGRPRKSGEDEQDAAELVAACSGLEIDGLCFDLEHVRRGEAILRVHPEADDRVTDTDSFFKDWYPVLRPQPVDARGASDRPRGGGLDTDDDRSPRRASGESAPRAGGSAASERDHAQVVGPPAREPDLLRAPRPARELPGGLEVPARARRDGRPRAALRPGDGRLAGRPSRPYGAGPRAPGRGRHVRLLAPQGDRHGRAHEGPGDQEAHDRGARRRARRAAHRTARSSA